MDLGGKATRTKANGEGKAVVAAALLKRTQNMGRGVAARAASVAKQAPTPGPPVVARKPPPSSVEASASEDTALFRKVEGKDEIEFLHNLAGSGPGAILGTLARKMVQSVRKRGGGQKMSSRGLVRCPL